MVFVVYVHWEKFEIRNAHVFFDTNKINVVLSALSESASADESRGVSKYDIDLITQDDM